MAKVSVLLADDHTIVREGLRALLEAEGDIEIVGEADSGRQAVDLVAQLQPEVVVLDIAMPLLNGLMATRQIVRKCPNTRVLVLSAYSDTEYVQQLVEAGAIGYLLKQSAAQELAQAIREVHRGNAYFCPSVSRHLLNQLCDSTAKPAGHQLTARECEVLQLVAEGLANKQIAAELAISIKTVEKHRQQVMNKLNIHETAGLTRYAIAHGIIQQMRNPVI
jgi:DNA-binding NarL/FixJ family response regulator